MPVCDSRVRVCLCLRRSPWLRTYTSSTTPPSPKAILSLTLAPTQSVKPAPEPELPHYPPHTHTHTHPSPSNTYIHTHKGTRTCSLQPDNTIAASASTPRAQDWYSSSSNTAYVYFSRRGKHLQHQQHHTFEVFLPQDVYAYTKLVCALFYAEIVNNCTIAASASKSAARVKLVSSQP